MESIMKQNKKICRLCLLSTTNREFVEIYQHNSVKYNLLEMINNYFNIEISENDSYSKIVCNICLQKLDDFYYFVETVKYNNNLLLHNFASVGLIKTKVEDEKDNLESKYSANMSDVDDVMHESSNNSNDFEMYKVKNKRKSSKVLPHSYPETPNDIKIKKFYKFECDLCKDHPEITTFRSFKTHYKINHGIAAYIKCCGKQFKRAYALVEHINEHLSPNSLICPTCNKKLRTKQTLLLHMDIHVPLEKRPLKCKFCDMRFVRNQFLIQHETVHLTDDQLKFICDLCGKRFPTDWRLKTHLNSTHSTEKPFVCEVCAKSFKLKVQLQNHMYVHNGKEPHKKCDICFVWLRSPRAFYVHMKEKHDESAPKSFPCDKCNHVSPTRKALYAHSVNKHGPKKYNCKYCSEAFSSSNLLKSHMIKHTGPGEPKLCPFCPKIFRFRSGYYSHMKKAHPNTTDTIIK